MQSRQMMKDFKSFLLENGTKVCHAFAQRERKFPALHDDKNVQTFQSCGFFLICFSTIGYRCWIQSKPIRAENEWETAAKFLDINQMFDQLLRLPDAFIDRKGSIR